LGGRGYLNFIGNEFGHPEWLDFPREGNGNTFHHARRQFNLIDDPLLRYKFLNEFDKAMLDLDEKYSILSKSDYTTLKHEGDKVIVFEKDNLIFVFNFHPTKSFIDYRIGTKFNTRHQIVLSSDNKQFGGLQRVDESVIHHAQDFKHNGREFSLQVYIPSRCAIVLKAI
jgi:1,4-alpha-glucan branching enzyme